MAKNNAPKRGASRTPPPGKREIPNWLWMACGLAVGGFAMFLTRLEPGSDAVKRSADESPAKTAPQAQQPHKPKYDFYTLLPESEVIVPPSAQQQPEPAKPAKSTPPPAEQQPQPSPSQPQPPQPQLAKPTPPSTPTQPIAQRQPSKPAQAIVAPPQPTKPVQPAIPAQSVKPAKPAQQTAQAQPKSPAQEAARAEALLNGRTPPAVTAKPPALPKPAAATHYYLQAGAFRNKADADDARARIALLGQSARIEIGTVRGETWHRVVAGPFSSRQQLEQAQKQLAGDGFSNMLTQQR